jgi:hypothetical protein
MDRKDWTEKERNVSYNQYQSSGGGECLNIKFSTSEQRENGYYIVSDCGFSLLKIIENS